MNPWLDQRAGGAPKAGAPAAWVAASAAPNSSAITLVDGAGAYVARSMWVRSTSRSSATLAPPSASASASHSSPAASQEE